MNLMKSLINFKNLNYLFLFSLIILSFYLSLYFVFTDYRDEIGYLSDSLLLAEGLRPSYSHSPTGISTWTGTLLIYLDFLITCIKNFSDLNMKSLFSFFDYTLFKNYYDLTNIKLSLFLINIIFIIYLSKYSKSSYYFEYFILIAFSPLLSEITFSGKPYFLAFIFSAIAFCLKKNKPYISIIFLSFAVSERLEYILLFNFLAIPNEKKSEYFKKIGLLIIVFSVLSPWFTSAIVQNIKVIFGYVHIQPSQITSLININLNILFFITLLLSIFYYPFVKNKKIKYFLVLTILLLFIFLSYYSNIPIRWFMPVISIIIYLFLENLKKISSFLVEKKIVNLLSIAFLILFINSLSNKKSDIQIIEKEKNFSNNSIIIGPKLLIEEGDFLNYTNFLKTYLYKFNSKNKFFFNDENAPLAFGNSGNLEILQNRRYEFLNKYKSKKSYSKFIMSDGGMYKNSEYYCLKFSENPNTYYFDFKDTNYKNCKIKKK